MSKILVDIFDTQINMIDHDAIRKFVKEMLTESSDYNAIGPAASSGKYHPIESLGRGGLVRHTKAVVHIVNRMMQCNPYYDVANRRNVVIAAAILHDMNKFEDETGLEHTINTHPIAMWKRIIEKKQTKYNDSYIHDEIYQIANLVLVHMSRWNKYEVNKDERKKDPTIEAKYETTPLPDTQEAWLLCYADMVSSDKMTHFNFDENWNIV
jgi:23S rRNA maturation-related 3'-5' exoribonuclease YhaM